ncbi:LysR substrate-binding domain-containing protein [Coriobacteriia bacterium Es71-Z0120]|uniref:LysR substrate-binding domain-containing protein n=1 Tax=Parvivirga hydrogeniphila TaxID=2939460 RepID=UPI0022610224|nr:LysR substrate-binding domain-containing protein [Parvivirga hydrogeniphila]MCL4078078.1 LysR substrate-binding domain-containing protein [Parvivirga hydrogeniphila]
MLNVNRLRLLREVAARGTIAAAADALFLTPSAVSQQLALLEREAKVPLLERVGRRVQLTPAGRALVEDAERIFAEIERAEAHLDAYAHGLLGPLRTCAFPTAARAVLVPALAKLKAEHPDLAVSMVDLEPEQSLPMLKAGELDVVVTYSFDRLPERLDPATERFLLFSEPISIALPADHPRTAGDLRVADLSQEQWIVGHDGSSFLEVVVRICNDAGFDPRVDLHSNDYQVILAAVQAGLGVAIVVPTALFADYPGVVVREPVDVPMRRHVHAVVRNGSAERPAISAALEALRSAAANLACDLTRSGTA